MASTLGSLVISLAVDTAKFQGDLGRAATLAESRMKNIKDTSTKALAAVTIAATAAGTALVVALKRAIDRADDFRDMASAAGVTVEQFSRLAYAGSTAGIEVEQIGKALAKLAKDGAPNANAALLSIADRFAAMPDSAEKTALAIDYFGEKLGPKLIPLLNLGAKGLADLAEQSDKLGFTIRKEAADGADEFNDSLAALGAVATGFTNQLAAEMLPALNAITQSMVDAAEEGDNTRRMLESLVFVMKSFVELGMNVALSFGAMGSAIGALGAAANAAAHGDFARAKQIILDANAEQLASEERTNERIAELWGERATAAQLAARRIAAISRGGGSGVLHRPDAPETPAEIAARLAAEKAAVRERSEMLKQQADAYADVLRAGQAAMDGLRTPTEQQIAQYRELKFQLEETARVFPNLAADAQAALQALERDWGFEDIKVTAEKVFPAKERSELSVFAEQAARNMQSYFADFFYSMDGGFNGMVGGFIDAIRRMVSELLAQELLTSFFGWGKKNFAGSWIGDMFSGLYDGVAPRASGGPVSGGSPYLVGERGPELFVPGSSGSIVPNHALAGGITIAPVYNIDNRGATPDAMAAIPAILEANNRRVEAMVKASIRGDIKRYNKIR
jgi:hypothetical protein